MEHYYHKAAWFPPRINVGGVDMSPPTLGQWRILEAMGNPLAVGGQASVSDALAACQVLSTPWRRARLSMRRNMWLFGLIGAVRFRKIRTPAHVRQVAEWLEVVWRTSERFVKDGEPQDTDVFPPCTSRSIRMALALNSLDAVRLSVDAVASVWDLLIPEALWILTADAERKGAEFEEPENSFNEM